MEGERWGRKHLWKATLFQQQDITSVTLWGHTLQEPRIANVVWPGDKARLYDQQMYLQGML